MSAIGAESALSGRDTPERSVLLLWMIFTGLSIFAVFLLWRYGLIHLMVASDRTYISSLIAVLYLVTCGHCFWRTRAIAWEGEVARGCRAVLSAPDGARALDADARGLPGGLVTDHIRSLVTKAKAQVAGRIDQTLLLRTLADRLRGSNGFGAFVSDTLMKLGLLGSIIVRIQYYMLDAATQRVFSDAVMLTETHVTPVLESRHAVESPGTPP